MNIGKILFEPWQTPAGYMCLTRLTQALCILLLFVSVVRADDVAPTAEKIDDSTSIEQALGLALKGVSLFNGGKGVELWRLKATWAHMTQEGDAVLVDAPVVRYTMGDPAAEDYLHVTSDKGRITDNQRYLNLWGNVRVTRGDEVVTAPRLLYDSQTRIMTFPERATLDGPQSGGSANIFIWDLNNNNMVGKQGVEVVVKAQQPDDVQSDNVHATEQPVVDAATTEAPVKAVDGKQPK